MLYSPFTNIYESGIYSDQNPISLKIPIIESMIKSILIGGLAGWLTGKFTKGEGYGIFANIGLGLLGGWFGSWILGDDYGFIGRVAVATAGAFVLVWTYKKFVK